VNLARRQYLFLKPNLSLKAKFTEGVKIRTQKRWNVARARGAVKKLRAMKTYEKPKNRYQLCLLLFNNHVGLKNNKRIYKTCVLI